jgi:HSP20 family protein
MNETRKNEVTQQQNTRNTAANPKKESAEVKTMQPPVDIQETKEGAFLYIDLPGVSKESLEIDVDKHMLTIKGIIDLHTSDNLAPAYMDIRSKVYERHFMLGEELDSSRIEASLKQGELKLFIPRSEAHKPRKIEVKVA